MAQVIKFARRRVGLYASLGTTLLVPPLICWGAVVLVIMGARLPAALLHGIEQYGGQAAELVLLVLCPLLAVVAGFTAIKRVPRGRKVAEAWCWTIIGAGVTFAVCAVLAVLRPT